MSAVATKSVSGKELRKDNDVKVTPITYPFWFGGTASCAATLFTHPLDLVKVLRQNALTHPLRTRADQVWQVRLQMQGNTGVRLNMISMFGHVAKTDGIKGLYRGLSAAQLRQMTYSMTRFGVYEALKDRFTTTEKKPAFLTLVAMASASGFIGGVVGNPGDILNVRMQHDAALPLEQRRQYKHAVDGFARMAREEGIGSLWRGVWPNSSRAVLMTVGQLATYDIFKRLLLDRTSLQDNLTTHFTASFMAGFVATTICSPVDVVKTRVMSTTENKSIIRLVTDISKAEGLRWMFKGWVPSFIRVGPHTILTFLFLEQHKKIYRQVQGI